tara:strand:- start:269 stop:682 length:414 start_codon:yes stop_codon:yes gene_type:complete
MWKNILSKLSTIFLIFIAFSSYTQPTALTLSECNNITADLNSTAPAEVDQSTIYTGSECITRNNDSEVRLSYEMELIDGWILTPEAIKNILLPDLITFWCTNPDQKLFLDRVGLVLYRYNYSDGTHIGEAEISVNDC